MVRFVDTTPCRHSRASGNPCCSDAKAKMDSRFRGNDGLEGNCAFHGNARLRNHKQQRRPKAALFQYTMQHNSRRAWHPAQDVQHIRQLVAHLPAIHDHVDRTVIQQEFRTLETFG